MVERMFLFALLLTTACGGSSTLGEASDTIAGPNIFECGIAVSCTQDIGHLGQAPSDSEARCGGQVLADGEGAVSVVGSPGPYPTLIETLVVLNANGSAFSQTRTRCGAEGACADQNTVEWQYRPLRLCEPSIDGADISGCDAPDGPCGWVAGATNCEDVSSSWTCLDMEQ